MKPPICRICDKRLDALDDGGLIYFEKGQSDLEWDKYMEEKGFIGHPPYADWFCKEHYREAIKLKHLSIDNAMSKLKT